jgi:zinc and cadmium transporter
MQHFTVLGFALGELSSSPIFILGFYCLMVLLASLTGGWLLISTKLTHSKLQLSVSCVAGLMLGMALLHFIPHAYFQIQSLDRTVSWTLGGFLAMFFLQRFFHYHHHDVPEGSPERPASEFAPVSDPAAAPLDPYNGLARSAPAATCAHAAPCGHHHSHGSHGDPCNHHTLAEESARQLSWVGTVIGLALHSLLDGITLGAAVSADSHDGRVGFIGLGAALAIILHKPFDAMAIATLMTASHTSRARRHLLNWLFALISPVGVLLFYFGVAKTFGAESAFVGGALAFCAGTFLCIAATDLLPELQFHSHDRLRLSVALLVGVGLAVGIGYFETSGHDGHHHHDESPAAQHQDVDHDH